MDYSFLSNTMLFRGTTPEEVKSMLSCLGSFSRQYEKDCTIYHTGEIIENMGLILSGSVDIENYDIWGNRSLLGRAGAGQIFAETYAYIPGEPLMVDVTSCEKSEILFLNASKLITTCRNSCTYHNRLIGNLLQISAQKNLTLSRRILHTSSKTIRGRLLSYLSEQAQKAGKQQFTIPFNRQQLADYLSVDRSAMSNELSKMQKEGCLTYTRNDFTLKQAQ